MHINSSSHLTWLQINVCCCKICLIHKFNYLGSQNGNRFWDFMDRHPCLGNRKHLKLWRSINRFKNCCPFFMFFYGFVVI